MTSYFFFQIRFGFDRMERKKKKEGGYIHVIDSKTAFPKYQKDFFPLILSKFRVRRVFLDWSA